MLIKLVRDLGSEAQVEAIDRSVQRPGSIMIMSGTTSPQREDDEE